MKNFETIFRPARLFRAGSGTPPAARHGATTLRVVPNGQPLCKVEVPRGWPVLSRRFGADRKLVQTLVAALRVGPDALHPPRP